MYDVLYYVVRFTSFAAMLRYARHGRWTLGDLGHGVRLSKGLWYFTDGTAERVADYLHSKPKGMEYVDSGRIDIPPAVIKEIIRAQISKKL